MFNCRHLLALLYVVYCIETPHAGTTFIPVIGKKGGNAILPCEFEARENSDIRLFNRKENIAVCQKEECESESRVLKKDKCDIVIKNLSYSDAGTYILKVFSDKAQRELESQTGEYHLQIEDEISVKTGEELKLDVLLSNADKVETNSSGDWREVWNRRDGVLDHHLTDTDGNLTIKGFTANDTGIYRVLDSKENILITLTVTESGSAGEHKASSYLVQDHWSLTEKLSCFLGIWVVIVIIAIVSLFWVANLNPISA